MSVFDFFFPQQAQASHLRSLVQQKRYEYQRDQYDKNGIKDELRDAQKRIEKMGNEMAETQLIVKAMMELMEEVEAFDSSRLLEKIKEIDLRDGVEDKRITPHGSRPKPKFKAKRNWNDS